MLSVTVAAGRGCSLAKKRRMLPAASYIYVCFMSAYILNLRRCHVFLLSSTLSISFFFFFLSLPPPPSFSLSLHSSLSPHTTANQPTLLSFLKPAPRLGKSHWTRKKRRECENKEKKTTKLVVAYSISAQCTSAFDKWSESKMGKKAPFVTKVICRYFFISFCFAPSWSL